MMRSARRALLATAALCAVAALAAQAQSGAAMTPSKAFGDTHDCSTYYPDTSRRLNQSGDVLIQYDVGVDGAVSHVKVMRSSGVQDLDQAALQCVSRHWRNTPALANGVPVASPGHQAIIRFTLSEPASDIGALAPYMSPLGASDPAPVANTSATDDEFPGIWVILVWVLGPLAILGWIVWGSRQWVFRWRDCPSCDARNRGIMPFLAPGYCSSCGTKFTPPS